MADKWETSNADESEFDMTVDFGDIGKQIEAEMEQHMARLSKELESKFGPEFSREIEKKLTRKAEKAAEKAKRAESSSRSVGMNFGSATQTTPRKQASIEEQMKILRMVESGNITPEEAAMLLEVLGD
ncbi:MAG: hypothetical protein R6X18_11580 [Chloroflexota bacterium]